jgi:hypothetical protein
MLTPSSSPIVDVHDLQFVVPLTPPSSAPKKIILKLGTTQTPRGLTKPSFFNA